MGWTRREFLQQTALTLAALGFSEAGLAPLTHRVRSALALPTSRKLALLVGINQYPESVSDIRSPARGAALSGCLTDVELQRELLIHRFGFQPSDVLCLTDQQATRQAIADAFQAHLTEQARPGDVVVFHFSGLGSRVRVGDRGTELQNTLVPVDGILPTEDRPILSDLPAETLELLLRSLPTDRVTAVLDLGYSDPGKSLQGSFRIRSRPHAPTGRLSEAEQAFQEQLRRQAGASGLPTVIAAAQAGQPGLEGQWSEFSAGLLTQALTQQLWQATPATTLQISLKQAAQTIEQRVGDRQQLALQQVRTSTLPYHLTADLPAADGVVTGVDPDGKTVQLWLGGIPAMAIDAYGSSSLLTAGTDSLPLQLQSRDGLRATATPAAEAALPSVGQRLQEWVRVLPHNVGLTIALDPNLERIERVDATSAFAAIPNVVAIAAPDQPADYRFGKAQFAMPALTAALPVGQMDASPELPAPKSGYGLFQLGQAAIPNTVLEADEAVKTAVKRIAPQLKTLLGMKLLRLIENSDSSRLAVSAALEIASPQPQVLLQRSAKRAASVPPTVDSGNQPALLPIGSRIQYRLHNAGDRPLYFALVGTDSGGGAVAFYPTPDSTEADSRIAAGETVVLPAAESQFVLRGPLGWMEMHVIFSSAPFEQTAAVFAEAAGSFDNARRIGSLSKPLETVQAILRDLHDASAATVPGGSVGSIADSYALDVNHWATFSLAYRVTEA